MFRPIVEISHKGDRNAIKDKHIAFTLIFIYNINDLKKKTNEYE